MEYFNEDGHLTKEALNELIFGEPDEMIRLEIAEHLSFCDECVEHYTMLLTGPALISPNESMAPSIMRRVRMKARRIFLNKYATFAAAACFALVLWTTGAFDVNFKSDFKNSSIQMKKTEGFDFYKKMDEKFNQIVDDIYDWKGVLRNGK